MKVRCKYFKTFCWIWCLRSGSWCSIVSWYDSFVRCDRPLLHLRERRPPKLVASAFLSPKNVSKIIKPFDKHHISSNLWHITSNNKIWHNNTTGWLFTTNQTSKSWLRSAPRWSHRISKPVLRPMVTHGNTAVWPVCSSAECTAMRAERGPLSGVWQKNNRSSTKKNTKKKQNNWKLEFSRILIVF